MGDNADYKDAVDTVDTADMEDTADTSNSNHRHPNLFHGKRAPQLVISTTSNSNHCKILFYVI